MIDILLQHFIPGLREHLSDGRLASLFCNELSYKQRAIAIRHLSHCMHCRLRQADLQGRRADAAIEFYKSMKGRSSLHLPPEPRNEFAQRFDLHLRQMPQPTRWHRLVPRASALRWPSMAPAFAISMACAVVASIAFLVMRQQYAPKMTSDAFLKRAAIWDAMWTNGTTGVVYQSIRITAPTLTVERGLYRDVAGKRSPRKWEPAGQQKVLRDQLLQAGVDWNEPISAKDYQAWLEQQQGRTEEITRPGGHLLTLTTTSPDQLVTAQSLTVRDTDFHPVQRTIAVRDVGIVEIAELDFKILPWNAVSLNAFEPLVTTSPTLVMGRTPVHEMPTLPRIVTAQMLDEADLTARLVLNQLHADRGEQIEIQRRAQDIVVEGVVETEERRRQLQTQLTLIPHVKFAIQSATDLREIPIHETPTSVIFASMPNQRSALELMMRRRGHGLNESNALAQKLANAALTISQESKAIKDLQTQFSPKGELTIFASATLSELIYSHRERLIAAMKRERALVTETQAVPDGVPASGYPSTPELLSTALQNLALLKELTQTDHQPDRSAEEVFGQMLISLDALGAAANDVFKKAQSDTALNGKK